MRITGVYSFVDLAVDIICLMPSTVRCGVAGSTEKKHKQLLTSGLSKIPLGDGL